MRRHRTSTDGEIAAEQNEESEPSQADSSSGADIPSTAPDSGPAPDNSLPSGAGTEPSAARRGPGRVAVLAVVLAAVLAVVGAMQWRGAANDEQLGAAKDRDAVLIAATSAIETLNSLDYQSVADDLADWADVTTGLMHDQIAATDEAQRQQLAAQQKVSVGEVLDAAVLRIDGTTATVVAAVEVTVTDATAPGSEPTLKRNRFSADLKLVQGTWKIENLEQVAVNLS